MEAFMNSLAELLNALTALVMSLQQMSEQRFTLLLFGIIIAAVVYFLRPVHKE